MTARLASGPVTGEEARQLAGAAPGDLVAIGAGPLLDPDCRDGRCVSCTGAPCEHECHQAPGGTP